MALGGLPHPMERSREACLPRRQQVDKGLCTRVIWGLWWVGFKVARSVLVLTLFAVQVFLLL